MFNGKSWFVTSQNFQYVTGISKLSQLFWYFLPVYITSAELLSHMRGIIFVGDKHEFRDFYRRWMAKWVRWGSGGVPQEIFEKEKPQKHSKRHSGTRYCFEKFQVWICHFFVTEFSKCHNMSQNFRQVNFVTECHHVTGNPFSGIWN